jgi:hypothetical protein
MKWKIYFLLFTSLLSLGIFTISEKTAHAIESYKISPAQDREFHRNYYQSMYLQQDKPINLHYYFYAPDKYLRNIKLISYICENKYDNYKDVADCGLYMVQEAGSFKIKVKASGYTLSDYDRETQESTYAYVNHSYDYNNFVEIESFTDADFKKGFTLLGGTTLKSNTWNLNEGGFLLDPVGGSSSNSNNGNNSNNSVGGFDILGGIKAFFQPMIDSIVRTQKAVLSITDNIINGIKSLFVGLIDSVRNIWDFLSNFFVKLFEELGKFFKWLFVLDSNVSKEQIDSFSNKIKNSSPEVSSIFNFSRTFSNRVSGNSTCSFGVGGLVLSVCSVPSLLINIARALIIFAMVWITIDRIVKFISVLFGTRYMWQREGED